jgi:hypothetical protein
VVNALVQLVTLLNGLLLNFLAPAIYGLHDFGEFIAANAMVFLVYKCVVIISEPLIRLSKPSHLLFILLTLSMVAVAAMALLSLVWSPGSLLMLAGILMLSNVFITLQAMRLRRLYVAVQLLSISLFVGLLMSAHFQQFMLSIERLMEWATLIPASVGVVMLLVKRVQLPTWKIMRQSLADLARHMPNMLSITAVMNLFTNALPLFLAGVLIPRDLGLFRVATALIQAATSVFPVSTQAVLVAFNREGVAAAKLYASLAQFALVYFSLAALVLMLAARAMPTLAPYALLATCLPSYYVAVLAERFLTSHHALRSLRITNLAICVAALLALLMVDTLADAMLHYATGLTLYAVVLSCIVAARVQGARATAWVLALCPVAVAAATQHSWIGMVAMVVLLATVTMRSQFSFVEIKTMLRNI